VTFNPSDSKFYYLKTQVNYRGDSWFDYYGTSTIFIEFLTYPFVNFLLFSYEAMMALFSFFGFIGFIFFYIVFKENIRLKHKLFGVDLLTLAFFLPNLHFWSGSLGKGSVIFLGFGLFFFGLSKLRARWIPLLLGSIIIYHVRPHIMLVTLVSCAIAFIFTSRGVSTAMRMLFLAGAAVAFFFIYQDVLLMVGIDEEEFVTQGLNLSHRASELGKATSGVDINSYSLPFQLFTFLYRPLFIDAPGILGLIVSAENLIYLILTIQFISRLRRIKLLFSANFLVKSAFLSFMTVSLALAQVSGNLGLAMRQKSQVMILFLFTIISVMDDEKILLRRKKRKPVVRAGGQNAGKVPLPSG
jgi:hypothetical protein